MTTHNNEAERLESEIAERTARLEELRAPMAPDEAASLAKSDPDEFNRRVDAAKRAGRNPYEQGER